MSKQHSRQQHWDITMRDSLRDAEDLYLRIGRAIALLQQNGYRVVKLRPHPTLLSSEEEPFV